MKNLFNTHFKHLRTKTFLSFICTLIWRLNVSPTIIKNNSFFINNQSSSLEELYWNEEHNYSNHLYIAPLFNGSLYHKGIDIPEASADEYSDLNTFDSYANKDFKTSFNKSLSASNQFNCLVRPWYPEIYSKTAYDGQFDLKLRSDFYLTQKNLNKSIYSDGVHRSYASVSSIRFPPILTKSSPQLGMEACEMYQANSCCTAEQSDELMLPIRSHSGYRWDLCGPPKKECNQVMAELECFYECSPYVSSWYINLKGEANKKKLFEQQIQGVPLCADFCDLWFSSCIKEKTCANGGNWVSGHQFVMNESRCLDGVHCSYFNEVYKNAETMCNTLWGSRYKYESDTTKCFDPRKVHNHEKIWKLLKNEGVLSSNNLSKMNIAVFCVILLLKIFV